MRLNFHVVTVVLYQRFGSGSVPTHLVGAALLRGEWKGAAALILDPREGDILKLKLRCTHYTLHFISVLLVSCFFILDTVKTTPDHKRGTGIL